ncbi:hypothetical protein [Sporohalobacter salinus]|uniref:hypothetical protein n=1 Tax=Sporohalobacter salinus TaxID=1494606 RepID=UPI00195FAC7F|nr:hypothetical protein [Sporohalobacter salinus]MBM7623494.1 biopolymer transport protein ExbB/TolQ [Sporohalobacter salinus]
MLKILILILGISFIVAALFLTYRQEKKVGHELRKREVRLNRLLQQVNVLLDRLENGYSELEKHKANNNKQNDLDNQRKEKFTNALESKLSKISQQNTVEVEDLNKKDNITETIIQDSREDEVMESNSNHEKYEEVNKLLNLGLNYSEIAKELNMGRREVELICKLND